MALRYLFFASLPALRYERGVSCFEFVTHFTKLFEQAQILFHWRIYTIIFSFKWLRGSIYFGIQVIKIGSVFVVAWKIWWKLNQ